MNARARKRVKTVVIPRRIIQKVEKGIKFLDILLGRKEWLSRMDLSHFEIDNKFTCVCGNIFKNGMAGYDAFTEAMEKLKVSDEAGIQFGFNEDENGDYPFLQDVWLRRIKSMKRAAHIK